VEDTEYADRLYRQSPWGFFTSQTPLSWHHHYHTLKEFCDSLYRCGFKNIPYLNSIKPQVAVHFGTRYAAFSKETVWRGLAGRLLLRSWLVRVVQWLYGWVPFPISNGLVRYLGLYYLVKGYRDWLLNHGSVRETAPKNAPLKPNE